ncbi:hypothetical protein [Puniceibacterium sediminis]|uniref:MetA-pathway of phenol degradation n=1 Tax=Puniceibacterium sediminis TaxID=1608407 RepID=A0A238ZEY5_9RHOB|nr:hypothetical protein [Puniceibacterium sediminis]SNR81699.1 hypothetical protein SAMN06265370_1309 [Puniceibacterium sediminis]
MRILVALLVLMLLPAPAKAGAWPRDQGTWFVSSDMRLSWPQDLTTWTSAKPVSQYYTIYAEYGLTQDLTLGLDLGRSVSGAGKMVAFLRMPLPTPLKQTKLALELGIGRIEGRPVIRPGLSVGRAIQLFGTQGWIAADGVAEIAPLDQRSDLKLDLTYGVTLESGTKIMLQFQSGRPTGFAPFARLAPSVALPFGRNRMAEIGVTYGLRGDDTFGIKMGIWQTF